MSILLVRKMSLMVHLVCVIFNSSIVVYWFIFIFFYPCYSGFIGSVQSIFFYRVGGIGKIFSKKMYSILIVQYVTLLYL